MSLEGGPLRPKEPETRIPRSISREDRDEALARMKERFGEEKIDAFLAEIQAPDFMKEAQRIARKDEREERRRNGYRDEWDDLPAEVIRDHGKIFRTNMAVAVMSEEVSVVQALQFSAAEVISRRGRGLFKIILKTKDTLDDWRDRLSSK